MPSTNPIRPAGKPPTAVLSKTPIYEDEPRMMRGEMTRPWMHFFAELVGWAKKTDKSVIDLTDGLMGKLLTIPRAWYLR